MEDIKNKVSMVDTKVKLNKSEKTSWSDLIEMK
jgi:hypothetical protein